MNLDRRSFLITSVTAAQTAFAQASGERIGTAMIGTGNRGSSVLKGILEQPNAKVVALCDKNPDRLDKAATSAAKDNPTTYTTSSAFRDGDCCAQGWKTRVL
jgi:myo-inositol 2-dehydrogenase/D-chiro-inositol 1-dehydrogenase